MEKFQRESKKKKVDKFKSDSSEFWVTHEDDVAETFQGDKTIGSGNKPFYKGDVKSDMFLVEAKSSEQKSIGIKAEWLKKISDEAYGYQRLPAVHLRFGSIEDGLCERDWVMVPQSVFKRMLARFGDDDVR